ncbi:MAG: hypothetical protein ACJAXI_002396 [Crocinitomicaceae bacterium]|jgi:hypothetical protein
MKHLSILLSFFFLLGFAQTSFSQNAPGAVNTNIFFWLKADAGLTTAGVNVTAWADQSSAATAITVNGSPDKVLIGRNYNPIIDFTKSNGVDGGDFLSTADANIQSYFSVAQLTELTRRATHIVSYDDVTTSQPCGGCALHGGSTAGLNAAYGATGYGNNNFQAPGVWRTNGDPTGVNNITPHSGNFDLVSALGTGTGSANVFLGGQSNAGWFNGRVRDWFGPVAELIVYSGPITTAEANKIESYLAIKYGITLGGNGSTTVAYTAPGGTVLWAANSGYHNNVIGIGRENNQELFQKQSHSEDDTIRIYRGALANSNIANTSTIGNFSYILIGDNQGQLHSTVASNAEVPGTCGLSSRLEREWKVRRTSMGGTFGVDITLNPNASPGSVNVSELRFLVDNDGDFSNGGTTCYFNGDGSGIVISYANPVISVTGISTGQITNNSTRYFTIGSINQTTPLPVELTEFKVSCLKDNVELSWTTASENNNDYFTIERSRDGINFEAIATIDGIGASQAATNYSWTDDSPLSGIAYYKLSQTDFNGLTEEFSIRSVNCNEDANITIYPNPFDQEFILNSNYGGMLTLTDNTGKVILNQLVFAGQNSINTDHISSGCYIAFISLDNGNHVIRKLVNL